MRILLVIFLFIPAFSLAQTPAAPVNLEKSDFVPAGMTRVKLYFNSDTGYAPVNVHAFIELQDYTRDTAILLVNRELSFFDTLLPDTLGLTVNAWARGYGLKSEWLSFYQERAYADTISLPVLSHSEGLAFHTAPPGSGPAPALQYVVEFLRLNPGTKIYLNAGCEALVMSDQDVRQCSKRYCDELRKNLRKLGADGKRIRFGYDKEHSHLDCGLPYGDKSDEELRKKNYGFSVIVSD